MATLILGGIGKALFGAVGAVVGTLGGSMLDRFVLGGRRRAEGPRLADLAVQSAAYGEPLTRVYGRMRVAGHVIWSSGLIETRTTERHGRKGSSVTTTSYSYAASFAVAVSARPIVGIGRIWADGKLIRGESGALTVGGTLRVYTGSARQRPDALLEAALGAGIAPAHRGLAYVVFEQLQLAEFANRIPNLTFEVIADAGPGVSRATIAADALQLAGGAGSAAALSGSVVGFAWAHAGSVRDGLEALAALGPLSVGGSSGALSLASPPSVAHHSVMADQLVPLRAGDAAARFEHSRQPDALLPRDITVRYADPAHDYQPAIQSARAPGHAAAPGRSIVDLAAALSAADAQALAERTLLRHWRERDTATIRLGPLGWAIRAGDAVQLPTPLDRLWQVATCTHEQGGVTLDLRALDPVERAPVATGDSGSPTGQAVQHQGPTVLRVLDLPGWDGAAAVTPLLVTAVAGASAAWRQAAIWTSVAGQPFEPVGTQALPSIMGTLATAVLPAASVVWDEQTVLEIDLLAPDIDVLGRTPEAVLAGANLAMLGDEVLQFTQAMRVSPARVKLSGLLRGRFGTEAAAAAGHPAGAAFVLLDRAALLALPVGVADLGQTIQVKATGPTETVESVTPVAATLHARALRPLAPVQLTGERSGTGDLALAWIRRSRAGWAWLDGTDAPLAEEQERYRVSVVQGGTVVRQWEVLAPAATYSAADQQADFGAVQALVTMTVEQLSASVGPGAAITATL
jgi:hypothetical protein